MNKQKSPRSMGNIDLKISERLRAARQLKKISQADAGEAIGVSFQQIQKYEKGVNRVAAGNLQQLCELYGVTYEWLVQRDDVGNSDAIDIVGRFFEMPYAREIATLFVAIKTNGDRALLRDLALSLAGK